MYSASYVVFVSAQLWSSPVFFFQAEDGIRDTSVTGVQTCALPILAGSGPAPNVQCLLENNTFAVKQTGIEVRGAVPGSGAARSEERRVGKEGRSRRRETESKKQMENQ